MLSDLAAEQLVRLRKRRGMTREQLAERCGELGWPALTTGVIGTIETGRRDETGRRRREISVDELVVLARALAVPPIALLAPVGYEDHVEVLPDVQVSALRAYRWLSGAETWSDDTAGRWSIGQQDPTIAAYEAHDEAWMRYVAAQLRGDDEAARRAWRDVTSQQQVMSEAGWRIPPMPGEEDQT